VLNSNKQLHIKNSEKFGPVILERSFICLPVVFQAGKYQGRSVQLLPECELTLGPKELYLLYINTHG
jgi:hypothetical protein